jgi:hypothetical protein
MMLLRGIYRFLIIPWGLIRQFQRVFRLTWTIGKPRMVIPGFLGDVGGREGI